VVLGGLGQNKKGDFMYLIYMLIDRKVKEDVDKGQAYIMIR
jgi:hypothetical protein